MGHLDVRMEERCLFLKLRHDLTMGLRTFYETQNFLEITAPMILGGGQCEGGSDVFELDYFGQKASLTQSSQLYVESIIYSYSKVFTLMPSFRAEKSKTSRHLTQFTHLEGEMADITFTELMDHIEALLRFSIKYFYEKNLNAIQKLDPDFTPIEISEEPFKRISYKDAIDYFNKKNHMKTDGTPYVYMDDISDASEKYLCMEYGNNQPVFLTLFPSELKSFYMKRVGEGLTESCDLLFPGIGETVGGSMRIDDYEELYDAFLAANIEPEGFSWYMELSKYGPCPHGGYGLGFERLLMALVKYRNVDQAILYPRKVHRITP
ncbi:uncharacterized protein LOC143922179 [Arctopsyche grandis]|uniref:uncharacterized protein LOC143922179 n=1 Tax=Arctopsyche grandis TaxID=121162 RepID=UPI00406DA46E